MRAGSPVGFGFVEVAEPVGAWVRGRVALRRCPLLARFTEANFRFRVPVDLGQVKARGGLRRRDDIGALLVLRRTPQPPPGLH
jgi:hypothetical protein